MKLTEDQKARAGFLKKDLTKVRCWLSGFHAGRGEKPQAFGASIAGEDSLRQAAIFLDEILKADAESAKRKKA